MTFNLLLLSLDVIFVYFLGLSGGVRPSNSAWQIDMNVLFTEDDKAGTVTSTYTEKMCFYELLLHPLLSTI